VETSKLQMVYIRVGGYSKEYAINVNSIRIETTQSYLIVRYVDLKQKFKCS
jgi:hypothetical protein